ncbi:MAG: hypothetical protein K6G63_00525, partial [Eubacterium sp.]|nr:hypothetical protein [Eubacterium sp.]
LVFKAHCKHLYEKYWNVFRPILKFLMGLCMFGMVFYRFPFNQSLSVYSPFLVVALAILSAWIPDTLSMALVAATVIAEICSLSYAMAFAFFAVLVIYFLLFGRYAKKQSYILILIPLLSVFNMSYAVPVIAALFLTPAMIPACIMGVFVKFITDTFVGYFQVSLSSSQSDSALDGFKYLADNIVNNKEMLVYMATFSVVYLVVYIVRKASFNYASYIATITGIVMCMAGMIVGDAVFSLQIDLKNIILGIIFTTILGIVVCFFKSTLDYTKTKNLQFEDDDYYYYVKAIPKLKVAVEEKTLTRIKEDKNKEITKIKEEIEEALDKNK